MYGHGSWFNRQFTPWARAAIRANDIDPDELHNRVPDGWHIGGSAKSAKGPYAFSLLGPNRDVATAVAYRWNEVPAALDRLLAKAVPA